MKTLLVLALAVGLLVPGAFAQQVDDPTQEAETDKLAQTGFKFLSVSLDARAAGMSNAMTAIDQASSVALFYNPAGMARLAGTVHATAGLTQWIADIGYNFASAAFSPAQGRYGVFGVSLMSVDYGEFLGTIRSGASEKGYEDFDDIGLAAPSPTALAVGVGYAKALTDRFSVGGQIKYARQDLGSAPLASDLATADYSKNTVAVDFGVLYNTGFRSLNFAMSARNFSSEIKYVRDNFELPLMFQIGVSMDVMDLTTMSPDMHSFVVAIDAARPRDFSEYIQLGGEYTFMDLLSLRAGYLFPADEQGVSLGAGIHPSFGTANFGFDYAFTSFGTFDPVHRLAVQVGF